MLYHVDKSLFYQVKKVRRRRKFSVGHQRVPVIFDDVLLKRLIERGVFGKRLLKPIDPHIRAGVQQGYSGVERIAHVGVDEHLGLRAGGFAHRANDQLVAFEAGVRGHPARTAADLYLEVQIAVLVAGGNFAAEDVFDLFLICGFQIVDIDRAVVHFDRAFAAGTEQAVQRQIHHPRHQIPQRQVEVVTRGQTAIGELEEIADLLAEQRARLVLANAGPTQAPRPAVRANPDDRVRNLRTVRGNAGVEADVARPTAAQYAFFNTSNLPFGDFVHGQAPYQNQGGGKMPSPFHKWVCGQ